VIDQPAVGLITLDCDNLTVARDDLLITVYTAEPGTDDADRLALAIMLGTQRGGEDDGPLATVRVGDGAPYVVGRRQ
jgi:hypothetical protein